MSEPIVRPHRYTRQELEAKSKEEIISLFLQQQDLLFSLLDRVEALERRVGMSSANSSCPPSSDGPAQKAARGAAGRKRRKRKRGARVGHEPHLRELAPVEKVKRIHNHKPKTCGACDAPLSGIDPDPRRHQVWDVPPPEPIIEEHRLHTLVCANCNHSTTASLPAGVTPSAFGPGALATVAHLTGVLHASKRATQNVMEELFGIPMSLGAVSACEAQVSESIAAPVEEAHRQAQQEAVAHADETGWSLGNRIKGWLWVIATPIAIAFMLQSKRGKVAAQEILGAFAGILHTDRWAAYNVFGGLRQLCWAHLKRDFTAISELGGEAERVGKELLRRTNLMFRWWHRVRDGTMSRDTFQRKMRAHRIKIEAALAKGAACQSRKTAGMCKHILKQRQWLWVFVDHKGVEPTNNLAERVIRPAVLWRKGSFGVQSETGRLYVERILTAYATCKLHHRSLLEYLRAACAARICGRPAPSLLPEPVA